jgi:hypothetical protein
VAALSLLYGGELCVFTWKEEIHTQVTEIKIIGGIKRYTFFHAIQDENLRLDLKIIF